jgi:hypothetical protein
METKKAVREWEDAYRRYRASSDEVARVRASDPVVLKEMADASHAVAIAWRRIAVGADLPWWSLAATLSAVEAFEEQSQHWRRRVEEVSVHGRPKAGAGNGRGADGAWFAGHAPGVFPSQNHVVPDDVLAGSGVRSPVQRGRSGGCG